METKIATVNISQEEYDRLFRQAFEWRCVVEDYEKLSIALKEIHESDNSLDTIFRERRAVINNFLDDLGMRIRFRKEGEKNQ